MRRIECKQKGSQGHRNSLGMMYCLVCGELASTRYDGRCKVPITNDDVKWLPVQRAGQAVVQIMEDSSDNMQYAIKFFLSSSVLHPLSPDASYLRD